MTKVSHFNLSELSDTDFIIDIQTVVIRGEKLIELETEDNVFYFNRDDLEKLLGFFDDSVPDIRS